MEKKKFILRVGIGIIAVMLIAIIVGLKISNSKLLELDAEEKMMMTYDKVGDNENATQSDYVKFDAFFLKKQAGTNKAEGVRGTCKKVGEQDTIYMELNVLTNGHLDNARIIVDGDKNYYLETAIVKDSEIAKNSIETDAREIVFKDGLASGTQKLLTAVVKSGDYRYETSKTAAIGNNIENYSKVNSITLKGTFVPDDPNGETIEINKKVDFKVDWYGETKTEIPMYIGGRDNKYQEKNIQTAIDEENQKINLEFSISVQEVKNELLLKKSYVEGQVPALNGYAPEKVEVTGTNVTYTYNKNTKVFTAQREAVEENGKIKTVANSGSTEYTKYNEYKLKITYPLDAYKSLGADTIEYKLPVKAYYEGYNNINSEFKNPYKSNIAQDTFVITFKNPQGQVARFDVYVGKYIWDPWNRYVVSKRKPLNIYNGLSLEEIDDTYEVRWNAFTGNQGAAGKMVISETKKNESKVSDEFINKDSKTESMEDVTKFVGIYFGSLERMLGEDGKIEVYNDDTNELLETFTKNNWSRYSSSNPYRYKEPVKHIRIETSNVNANSSMSIYNVKELDDSKITSKYTQEQFENLRYIKGTVTGYIGGGYVNTDIHQAYYEVPVSIPDVNLSKTGISTQETEKNMQIRIQTRTNENENQEKWTNGAFLLKMPKSIIDLEINDVKISNSKVEIINYETYEDDENIFIKIYTENEEPASYQITIDCNITPDPSIPTTNERIDLYAYNEYNPNYYYKAEDMYDVNDNGNVTENVSKTGASINLISPNSLLTSQIATEYDENGSITVAPKIAPVSKEQRQAKITINLTNNYENTIGKVKLIGKIPFSGNTYVINKGDMGSNFDTKIANEGIILPAELQGKAVVYYSEKENPDINNPSDWTTTLDVTKVKTFLIDLGNNKLARGEKHNISYKINIPEGLDYNQVSYSHHAVYFTLDTNEGEYDTQTEPNKLGFRIEKRYDLELTKYHKDKTKLVQGATYRVKEEGEDEAKSKVTDENGKIVLKNLYVDKKYTVKEIKSPIEYELNEEEISFRVIEEDGKLKVVENIGNNKRLEAVKNDGEDWKVELEVEDEARANLKIVKQETGKEDVKLSRVKYNLTGKGMGAKGRTVSTNINGEINTRGLYIGEQYTLEEIQAEGYYLASPIKFRIINENGNYKVNILEGGEKLKGLEEVKQNNLQTENEIPILNLNIENDKIPTYDLVIDKVKKDEIEPVVGAKFRLYKGDKVLDEYETDAQGKITINGLYQYEKERNIDQTYTLKETYAPEGFVKVDDITFYAEKEQGQEGVLTMHKLVGEVKEIITQKDKITITVEDSPTFKLTKRGEIKESTETKRLEGVKFAIYDYKTGKPATDAKGNIIGEKERINGKTYYTVKTDKNGEITANLPHGLYKAVEMDTYEEYELGEEKDRTYYFGVGESKEEVRKFKPTKGISIGGINIVGLDGNYIHAIAETSDGGIVVGGYFAGTIKLENGQVLENKRLF